MKPVAQVEKGFGWDAEARTTCDLRRVALEPSSEGGHFVVNHDHYGRVVVDKVVLLGVKPEDRDVLHAGALQISSGNSVSVSARSKRVWQQSRERKRSKTCAQNLPPCFVVPREHYEPAASSRINFV